MLVHSDSRYRISGSGSGLCLPLLTALHHLRALLCFVAVVAIYVDHLRQRRLYVSAG